MSGLLAHLVGGLARGFGLLALAEVVVKAAQEGGKPTGLYEEFAMLVKGEASLK